MLSNLATVENLNQVLKSELERQTDTDNSAKVQEESALKQALNGQSQKAGTQILASLAAKLAKQVAPAKLMNNLAEEYGFALEAQQENLDDLISISNPIRRISKPGGNGEQNQQDGSQLNQSEEAAAEQKTADVKEYIGAYSQMLVNGGQETKKKMEQLENRLLNERGISLKDLKGLKVQVANSVRSEVAQQIKDAFLRQVLTKSKSLDFLIAKQETNNVLTFAHKKANLGGYDFGGFNGNLQGTANEAQREVKEMLRDFVDDALKGEVMKKAMGGDEKEAAKEIEDLLKLGGKIGFDAKDFVSKIPKMKEDLGLNPVISFEYAGAGADAGTDQQRQHQYQYTAEEEKEVLTDKLRALYMRRAVYGDMRTVLETQFKMIKTKNGLIKLGVVNFDQVQQEATACAKFKLFDMLREAFEERATYAKLSGEAWNMTERKIKTVLKNLEKLGVTLDKTELEQVRDKANEKMYREAEHELALINTAIAAQGELKYHTTKRKTVTGILQRLAEESGFKAPGHELEESIREAC